LAASYYIESIQGYFPGMSIGKRITGGAATLFAMRMLVDMRLQYR